MTAMELGLAHSLSRYKLKFSPDKIDTMIVQVGHLTLLLSDSNDYKFSATGDLTLSADTAEYDLFRKCPFQ